MINELLLFNKWPYFQFDKVKLLNKYTRWLKVADVLKISKTAKQRLKWIIYYYEKTDMNVSSTARHFGISRKTFHKWFREFDENNLYTLHLLEDRSKAPKHVRQKEITNIEKNRIIRLRKKHMKWGKMKLKAVYTDGGDPVPVTVVGFAYKGNDLIIIYIDSDGVIRTSDDQTKFTFVERLG